MKPKQIETEQGIEYAHSEDQSFLGVCLVAQLHGLQAWLEDEPPAALCSAHQPPAHHGVGRGPLCREDRRHALPGLRDGGHSRNRIDAPGSL